ncbi:DUF3616 domain-containing protein [Cyanobium sp. LEGE 06143]|uniref:DUF3616 domain-containing protein n=1 Tax=Cyanobium sp. LEGE 06143 TaxID=945727 RepID=UPI00188225C5|nr:DUF3616 domain-containing protein [Cyanobium sp. LEGE 06143]MBE9171703.1 DUF3616 domain-containing protein [Cyanobium sp. LEGE 06143]
MGKAGDKKVKKLQQNLSALAARDRVLWLGGDEERSLYWLKHLDEHRYGDLHRVKLKDFGLAGGKDDGESDIEGLALDGDRLWLIGSHSLRRRKHNDRKGHPLDMHDEQSRNAHVLGCLRLDGAGLPVSGQRLEFDAASPGDALTQKLAADSRIGRFMKIPSKENGLDIEGIAARGERLLVGLRGPVLRGIALVLDLRLAGLDDDGPTLSLAGCHCRYLQLAGLAVRDLAVVPGSDDVLVLAGPSMTQAGPCYLYRWRNALGTVNNGPVAGVITLEELEPLLWIRDGRPGRPDEGSDKPEGLEVQRHGGRLLVWVAYDDPTKTRRRGQGSRTRLDGFVLP